MPIPPPPFASNLLDNIQTDSDDTDNEDDKSSSNHNNEKAVNSSTKLQQQSSSVDSSFSNTKKKKRKRRKRKKSKKEFRFGGVHVREYERCLGLDGVPLEGGWPLGISPTIVKEYQAAESVHEFEERRQVELRERWIQVLNQHGVSVEEHTNSTDDQDSQGTINVVSPLSPTEHLETRQYDYRKRINEITQSTKNPLFGPLKEEERMLLLVRNDSTSSFNDDDNQDDSSTITTISNSPGKSGNRVRSNSMAHSTSTANDTTNKRNMSTTTRRARANSEAQLFSENFSSTNVMHIQHELEQVRIHRTLEGSTGCTCRKLDVYLPPPNGGGKKAQHRRMKPQKVIEELRKRGKLPNDFRK